jgi:hypothetical protein
MTGNQELIFRIVRKLFCYWYRDSLFEALRSHIKSQVNTTIWTTLNSARRGEEGDGIDDRIGKTFGTPKGYYNPLLVIVPCYVSFNF